jgi:hypothetical protein
MVLTQTSFSVGGVEAVHHHDESLPARILRRAKQPRGSDLSLIGMARRIGVDDEGAVQALVDVPLQRHRVAVIEMTAEWKGIELVDESLSGRSFACARHASMRAA